MLILSVILDELAIPGASPWTTFPWKKMHITFGGCNISIHHWPEDTPLPPINVEDLEGKILGKSKVAPEPDTDSGKSFRTLKRDYLYRLALALRDKDHPLHFKVHTNGLPTGEFIATHTFRMYPEHADALDI